MYSGQIVRFVCLVLGICNGLANLPCNAAKRRFTVADDIALAHFGDPYTLKADPVTFSPDGRYFVVDTERGLIEENRPESTLRVFRTEDVREFLIDPKIMRAPSPIWMFSKSTYKDGPIITHIRWLADSTGFAFLAKSVSGNDQLFLADLTIKTIDTLTPQNQDVTAFDIRDRKHLVYSVLSPLITKRALAESQATNTVGTGRSLSSLLFPADLYPFMSKYHDLSELWAVVNGRRFRVDDKSSGRPLPLYHEGQQTIALSPDGLSVAVALVVRTVPPVWKTIYPPPLPMSAYGIQPGLQDLEAFEGWRYASQFALIDLSTGAVKVLIDAPTGIAAGWSGAERPAWSDDGKLLALPDTFMVPKVESLGNQPSRPCVAVVNLVNKQSNCVERYKGMTKDGDFENGGRYIEGVRFERDSRPRLIVDYRLPWPPDYSKGSTVYLPVGDSSWEMDPTTKEASGEDRAIDVSIRQDLNNPPVLFATDKRSKSARVILDPNPQLKDIDLGAASVFKWKDKTGRAGLGGLYYPPDYDKGQRYPLVVQTHGFVEIEFRPEGILPTAFAARELAGSGILVLQVNDCPLTINPAEGACNVAGYEAAVEQLVGDGLVDGNRVGIVGFSRSCYYVLQAMTTSTLHFQAASITDGFNVGYLQYITWVDRPGNAIAHEANDMIGAPPFGEGLQEWLKHSPEFNMERVTTPLQVVGLGRLSTLFMWEPYAALRYLSKPVDLSVLNSDEHILTNPTERMVSQGGTVDWFRFWLKGEEDPDPAKVEQYARWRELRKLQAENDAKDKAAKEPVPVN